MKRMMYSILLLTSYSYTMEFHLPSEKKLTKQFSKWLFNPYNEPLNFNATLDKTTNIIEILGGQTLSFNEISNRIDQALYTHFTYTTEALGKPPLLTRYPKILADTWVIENRNFIITHILQIDSTTS